MLIFDTIYALATAPYTSAIMMVRLSGPESFKLLQSLTKRDVRKLERNHAYFMRLYKDPEDPKSLIDEAVVTLYQGPKSYTGFDSVEFSLHGSLFVVSELEKKLASLGARRAEKGEFSAQAFYNGKMNLLKAEGINDLIMANSTRAKEIATKTLSGKNTALMNQFKTEILDLISQLEYYVEDQYTDEKDDYDEELKKVKKNLLEKRDSLSLTLEKTRRQNKEYHGILVAICGEPNVGKSTLLNALLGEDKAIVSPIPGTTRDVVEGEKEIDGILYRFKDTAGIRSSADPIENLGIERSYKTIEQADIVLLLSDKGFKDFVMEDRFLNAVSKKPLVKVATKKDLHPENQGDIVISSLKDDLRPLEKLMEEKLGLLGEKKDDSLFLGQREEDYLEAILKGLNKAVLAIDETQQIDIVSDALREVINTVNDLMGNSAGQTMEDIYETLFSKFCLGK